MISITQAAKDRINSILRAEGDPDSAVRSFVQGGGCSGFSYGFTIDQVQNDDDFVLDTGEFRVLVDSISMNYLKGSTIDYKQGLMNSQFVINNPNAVAQCGCGSSFSI